MILNSRGYITLISVVIIGAVGVSITTSLILLGLSSSRTSFVVEQSAQAKALVDTCADEALQQIRSSTSFVGSGTIELGQGSCAYTVFSQGGQNRTIRSVGVVNTVTRKVLINIDRINPYINVVSWKEVVEF